jgi:dihydroflavonol-4-reductase
MRLRAFVTGGTGFVGMNLVRQLVGQGWDVTALVRSNSPLEDIAGLDVVLAKGDITDAASLRSAMPKGVDGVFHVAASTNIWSRNNDMQTRVNVDGTRNMVEAALAAGARRFIHCSSFIVWGFVDHLLTEESERSANADWINYVRTKHEAERIVKRAVAERGLDAVILNPAHILGPGDRHNWSRVISLVDAGKLPGVPPGGGAFSDVREVARAHINAFHEGRTGENYLLGGEDEMFFDVVRITGQLLGRKVPKHPSPGWLLKLVARAYVAAAAITGRAPDLTPEGAAMITRHIECDSGKAVGELGYRFTPVRQLLEDTIGWMRAKKMLNEGSLD